MLAAAVIVLHLWLLDGLQRPPATAAADGLARAMQVRQLPDMPPPAAAEAAAPIVPPAGPRRVPRPGSPPLAHPQEQAGSHADESPQRPTAPEPAGPAPAVADASQAAAAGPRAVAVPVYATRLPPTTTLHYATRRGAATGSAELRWQAPAEPGGAYSLSLRQESAAGPASVWASVGAVDADGVAPERFSQFRKGRELRAANFQREHGRISFSGPTSEFALAPGAQDRVSWIVQLAAVLAANPPLARDGAEILMFVAGTQGDAEVWTFVVRGTEAVALAGGDTVPGLRLDREPARLYDTRVNVWLDPLRSYLPLRLRLSLRATGEGSDWLLEQ